AGARRTQRDGQRGAADRVGEVEHHLGLDVPAAPGPAGRRGPAAAREDRAEQVGEAGAAEAPVATGRGGRATATPGEQAVEVEPAATAGPRVAPERTGPEQRPHLVVLLATGFVGEHVVGLGDRL